MNKMNWQMKAYIIWFSTFFLSVIFSMFTNNIYVHNTPFILLIILGLIIFADLSRKIYFSSISSSWPATEYSVKKTYASSTSEAHLGQYNAVIEIEYKINGKRYITTPEEFSFPIHSSIQAANEYIIKVKSGQFGKMVYYNPLNPQISFVKPGVKYRHIAGIICGLGMVVVPYLTIIGKIKWH